MRKETPDTAARLEALDTRRSFILEAPAGSGKTALLAARFLALLGEVSHPRQILAVTFTRKAAAEMAERITGILREAHNGKKASPGNPWESHLLDLGRRALDAHAEQKELLWSPETFLVSTFHSFCASIARGWPLEAHVTPNLKLLEDTDQQTLLDVAVDMYLRTLLTGNASTTEVESLMRRLTAVNNSVTLILSQLSDLMQCRDRLKSFIDLFKYPRAEDEMERRLTRLAHLTLDRLRSYFADADHINLWHSLRNALIKGDSGIANKLPAEIPGNDIKDADAWKDVSEVFLIKAGTPRKQFKCPDFPPEFKKTGVSCFISEIPTDVAADLAFVAQWPKAEQDNVGIRALADMLTLAAGALQTFRSLMNTRGVDFTELELAALRALGQFERPGEGLIFFHEHLRHILVDEAQDVNDNQVGILGALTEGWGEPGDNRTVFVVGDPKQSIYRFRRAEVSLFYDLKQNGLPRSGESRLPLTPLALTANFRSRPFLVDVANHLFERVMAAPNKDFDEVDFAPSQAARDSSDLSVPVTAGLFYFCSANNKQLSFPVKGKARELEANYVAGMVAKRYAENSKATVGILIPARTHLSFYVKALETLGVPVELLEGSPMLESLEVRHLLNLFRALVRPYDDVAWAGVLRAPWCRVSNKTLERLAGLENALLWSDKIQAGKDVDAEIARFLDAYEKVRPDFGRAPYAESLKYLWEELNGPAAVVSMSGPSGLSNAMEFFRLLDQCPDGVGEEAVEYLQRLLEAAYTPPDPRATFSPVSMMTIHRAKGLEFDHVFAVGLDYDPAKRSGNRGTTPAFLMDRLPGQERLYLASAIADRRTGSKNLACFLLEELEKKRCMAEHKRLFYVAATRARESLTLTGLFQKKSNAKDEGAAQCAINWIWKADRDGCFQGVPFQLLENPQPTPVKPASVHTTHTLPDAPLFSPEPLPYLIQSPSKVEGDTATAVRTGAEDDDPDARARGVIIHRLFEILIQRGRLPDRSAVAAALATEGIPSDRRMEVSQNVLSECERAWKFDTFRELRQSAHELITEWSIEDISKTNVLRVGRIDLLAKTPTGAVLVDFKTGSPDKDTEAWLADEVERYRPQIKAYVQMAANVLETKPDQIRAALFFTAVPQWVEVG